jgi:recombination protein RecT
MAEKSEIQVVRHQLTQMEGEFKAALPAHIPVERFNRVVMTAIQATPKLLQCNRQSFFNSCVRAAQDGLLPDGREGAIVPYGNDAQWLPMIAGLRKKARNSGEIATWDVHAVFEKDDFDYELGDNPFIRHKPTLGEPGKLIAVYSIAVLKSGEISRDVMSVIQVEKIRTKSKGSNTPWNDPIFYPEMAKKTVAKRHAKVLPTSTDLDDLLRRDDDLYDLSSASDKSEGVKAKGLKNRLDQLADGPTIEHEDEKPKRGSRNSDPDKKSGNQADGDAGHQSSSAPSDDAAAYRAGKQARANGMSRKAIPQEYRNDQKMADAWLEGFDAEGGDA